MDLVSTVEELLLEDLTEEDRYATSNTYMPYPRLTLSFCSPLGIKRFVSTLACFPFRLPSFQHLSHKIKHKDRLPIPFYTIHTAFLSPSYITQPLRQMHLDETHIDDTFGEL